MTGRRRRNARAISWSRVSAKCAPTGRSTKCASCSRCRSPTCCSTRSACIARNFDPNAVQVSTLLSIKTGACPEDCAYCPQSIRYDTGLEVASR